MPILEAGIDMIIVNGRNPDNLYDIFDEDERPGTLFVAGKK